MLSSINMTVYTGKQFPSNPLPFYNWRTTPVGARVSTRHVGVDDVVNLPMADRQILMTALGELGIAPQQKPSHLGLIARAAGVRHYWQMTHEQMPVAMEYLDTLARLSGKTLSTQHKKESAGVSESLSPLKTIEQTKPAIQKPQPIPPVDSFSLNLNFNQPSPKEVVDCENLVLKALEKIASDIQKLKEAIKHTDTKEDLEKALQAIIC